MNEKREEREGKGRKNEEARERGVVSVEAGYSAKQIHYFGSHR